MINDYSNLNWFDLNFEIARRLGWKMEMVEFGERVAAWGGQRHQYEKFTDPDGNDVVRLPRWDVDLNWAIKLLADEELFYRLLKSQDKTWYVRIEDNGHGANGEDYDTSLPRAICNAWLQFMDSRN